MVKKTRIFLIVALALVAGAVSCSGPKVIPSAKMAKIYRDMYVADQWLIDNRLLREAADSTLFYESVFNKYGYTTEDYMHSVEYYLDDPERFGRILNKAQTMLEEEIRKIDEARKSVSRETERQESLSDGDKLEAAADTLAVTGKKTVQK